MKRYHILLYSALLLAWAVAGVANARCDRTPPNVASEKRSGDGHFHLSIEGKQQSYIPGESYLVTLEGQLSSFIGFLVTLETDGTEGASPGVLNVDDSRSLTTYSNICPNSITAMSGISKYLVTMRWTAPRPGSGCVFLQATVLEKHDVWYQDDGDLTRSLCEETSAEKYMTVLEECCAQNEAKYEVSFHGLWSRNTHPRHFPENEWETRYGDLIGASHSTNYRFWDQATQASEGMKIMAEFGTTSEIKNELLQQIGPEDRNVRTIIKSKGQRYPNRNAETFAIFRVDSKYHIVSLVCSIKPSPDWFLGVSGLELCLSNCSWTQQMSVKLYPWDAGTDNGVTYMSQNDPTYPPDTIRRLRVDSPNNPNSAFYDPDAKNMEPFAILTFTRLREYEVRKPTEEEEENPAEPERVETNPESNEKESSYDARTSFPPEERDGEGEQRPSWGGGGGEQKLSWGKGETEQRPSWGVEAGRGAGAGCPRMSEWGEWTRCEGKQGSCGAGWQFRLRHVLTNQPKDVPRDQDGQCNYETGDGRECEMDCSEQPDDSHITADSFSGPVPNVGVTGDGSLTGRDGPAQKTHYNTNYPDKRSRGNARHSQNDPFRGNINAFNGMNAESLVLSSDRKNQVQVFVSPDNSMDCQVSRWSEWSKCQGNCGVGERIRFRNIMRHNQNGGKACPSKLIKYKRCPLPPCPRKNIN